MAITGRKPDLLNQVAPSDPRQVRDPADAAGTITHLEPPDDLSDGASALWDVVTGDLVQHKLLKPSDLPLLVELIEAIALARIFRKMLYVEMAGAADSAEVKRLRTAWIESLRAAHSLAGDFGIGPVARVRLGLTQLRGQSLQDLLRDQGNGAGKS